MKYNILFAILLAVILSVGFYSMDLADILIENSAQQTDVIERNPENSRAIYLSENDNGFNPMSIVKKLREGDINSYNAEWRSVSSALAEALSNYSDEMRFSDYDAHKLFNAWRISRNNYIYIDRFEYTNPAGEKRLFDCIIHPFNYRVVYIRFYSDKQISASPERISRALATLDSYSQDFYTAITEQSYTITERLYEIMDDETNYSEEELEEFPWYPSYCAANNSSELKEVFIRKYNKAKEYIDELFEDSPMYSPLMRFWLYPSFFRYVTINDNGKYAFGTNYFFDEEIPDNIEVASYSSINGMIFQNVNVDNQRIIVIYNIADDTIEGFYAPPRSN